MYRENRSFYSSCFLLIILFLNFFFWSWLYFSASLTLILLAVFFISQTCCYLDKLSLVVALSLLWLVFSAVVNGTANDAVRYASVFFSGPLLFLCIKNSSHVRGRWLRLLLCVVLISACSTLWALAQYFEDFQRVAGTIIDPNNFAAIMYVTSLLLLSVRQQTLFTYGLQFLLLFCMFATFSRSGIGAWGLGVVGCGIAVFRLAPERRWQWLSYIFIAVLGYGTVKIIPLVFGYESVSRHFNDMHNLNARWPMWLSTWELIKQTPLLGSGFGSFALLYPSVRTELASAGLVAHNDYLQIWQEGGFILFSLFISWVVFHGWLLFRVLFLGHGSGNNRKIELAYLLTINLALFSHATLNFVFYNQYLNLVAWLLFARIIWLAMRSGLVKLPKRFAYGRTAGVLVSVLLCVVTVKLIWVESANAVYSGYENKPALMIKLAQDDDVLDFYLRIDPKNVQASEVYVRKLLAALPELNTDKRELAFKIAWQQVSLIQRVYPALPRFHVMAGNILSEGVRLNISSVPDMAMGHWVYALQVNPGFIPAHLRIADRLGNEKGARVALDYLFGRQLIWLNITAWPKAEVYWQEVKRLAEISDSDKIEQINQLIRANREKIDQLSSLRHHYKN